MRAAQAQSSLATSSTDDKRASGITASHAGGGPREGAQRIRTPATLAARTWSCHTCSAVFGGLAGQRMAVQSRARLGSLLPPLSAWDVTCHPWYQTLNHSAPLPTSPRQTAGTNKALLSGLSFFNGRFGRLHETVPFVGAQKRSCAAPKCNPGLGVLQQVPVSLHAYTRGRRRRSRAYTALPFIIPHPDKPSNTRRQRHASDLPTPTLLLPPPPSML